MVYGAIEGSRQYLDDHIGATTDYAQEYVEELGEQIGQYAVGAAAGEVLAGPAGLAVGAALPVAYDFVVDRDAVQGSVGRIREEVGERVPDALSPGVVRDALVDRYQSLQESLPALDGLDGPSPEENPYLRTDT